MIESHYEREERGYPPYHPWMMTKVLIYGYCAGVFLSRRQEKRLVEDIGSRVLAAGNEPDFRTIAEFRRINLKALEGLFEQVLRLALKQIAVEPALGLIVAQALTQEANDKNQMLPMIDAVKRQSGQKAHEVLADSGYCSEKNLCEAARKKIDFYVATGMQKHNQGAPPSPRGLIPKLATAVDRMKRKLTAATGRAIYATRKTIVESVFGQIKQARGFRRFLLRGVDKVRGEWALVCTTHNVLKLYRACMC